MARQVIITSDFLSMGKRNDVVELDWTDDKVDAFVAAGWATDLQIDPPASSFIAVGSDRTGDTESKPRSRRSKRGAPADDAPADDAIDGGGDGES